MNLYSPQEYTSNYASAGREKARMPIVRMFLLAVLAGFFIAIAGAASGTVAHTISNAGMARLASGLLFPFGLAMVILTGAELFTGNSLIIISVLNHQASIIKMLKNWLVVYLGNAAGAVLVAAGCVYGGQFDCSGGELAVYMMKLAADKCAIPLANAIILGVLCNILVTAGVLLSLSAQDLPGRVMGAYLPVAFFVICGFEHCVANMFYIPAGLFAKSVPAYAALAAEAGLDLSALTWQGFLTGNLLPVTAGNIAGGVIVGILFWYCHLRRNVR